MISGTFKRKIFPELIISVLIILLFACNSELDNSKNPLYNPISRDLDEIIKDGKLKALAVYSPTSYFLYRGQAMGFEYELLERLADYLDLELEIHISKNIDDMFLQLNKGDVDIVAYGLTITNERKKIVSFTDYLYLTHQVLVQKKPNNWNNLSWRQRKKAIIQDAVELIGDTVSVRKNSSYFERLQNLSEEIGGEIIIDTLAGNLETDKIIKMVADGEIKYTVADNNIASINSSYFPYLDIDVPISFSQRIAWAVRPNSPEFLKAVNQWGKTIKDKMEYLVIYNKYFKSKRQYKARIQSEFYSLNDNKISKYDELIKTYSEKINWDWRLVASLVYQESHFNPNAKSWAGAMGLMQVMPATAKGLGITNRADPEDNIRGGTKYLKILWDKFDMIEDSLQRIKFTVASYNCGYFHVIDAQTLAEENKLNRNLWDKNVEDMILELSYSENYNNPIIRYGYVRGIEPYTYVNQIFKRYKHYKQFID